ncbi:ComEC family competence protein [Candidatus Gracilibacteria bacterium]|nr:ComEC family competence protein [Candidatus Gracilibacteria bacterium]NUJ98712.1 ComEC family competence protein [Candidatus Gracilibacteria bacterium]
MSKHILFISSLIAFIVGVFLNNIFVYPYISLIILLFFSLFFINYILFSHIRFFIIYPFLLSFFLLGVFISYKEYQENSLKYEQIQKNFYTDTNKIEGEIQKLDTYNDYSKNYIIKLKKINDKIIENPIFGIVESPYNYTFFSGDNVFFESKIYPFQNFSSFNYEKYMLSKNLYFKAYPWSISFLGGKEKNKYITYLEKLRINILSSIHFLYPQEEAIFLGGILLGARENISKDLKDDFNNSGLTHLIAVSGFNITILILFFSFFFSFFPPFLKIVLISFFVIFFTFLVGYSAPVLRASLMGLLGFYIVSLGRKASFEFLFFSSLFLMILFNPLSLNYDISLQLSFFSVLGIVYLQKPLERILYFVPSFFAIKESLVLSISALLFTLPLIIINFGQMSIISPLSNIVVAPTIPFAMLFGFLSIILFPLSTILGQIFGYITYIFLRFDIYMVHFFGSLKISLLQIDFGFLSSYFLIIYYLLIFLFLSKQKKYYSPL